MIRWNKFPANKLKIIILNKIKNVYGIRIETVFELMNWWSFTNALQTLMVVRIFVRNLFSLVFNNLSDHWIIKFINWGHIIYIILIKTRNKGSN